MRIGLRLSGRLLMTVAAATLLSACSNSIERFSAAYDNPSDADPVYTASVPKSVQKISKKRPALEEPADEIAFEEPIVSKPLKKASLGGTAPKPVYDYATSYGKKKTTYKHPSLVAEEEVVAPVERVAERVVEREPTFEEPVLSITKKPAKTASLAASGAKVRVEPGMTLYSIARANGMSVQQLGAANGLSEPFTVPAGTVLNVPGASKVKLPVSSLQAQKRMLGEEQGTSLAAAEEEEVLAPPVKKIAKPVKTAVLEEPIFDVAPKPIRKKAKLQLDDEETPNAETETVVGEPETVVAKEVVKPVVKVEPKQVAAVDTPAAPVSSGEMKLRWPVVGKVISEYGSKPNGMKNEGINIAVPEGTSVRAAESGTVAYAGNELKGYGNLILVRHAGGYVTAYAHAKEILVKRGDKINRGDIIARAGQTGAVSSPQLHFEIRKGASAMDPTKFLRSSTAMN